LVVLEPAAQSAAVTATTTTSAAEPVDPYVLDNYLLTSSEGFSPFEQNLGDAPFVDKNGDPVWAGLAYVDDGGVHPCKVPPLNPETRSRCADLGCSTP
jgi:hypothetical protein